MMKDLPVIQKTYDLIKWYIPILNRLPTSHRFMLGNRIIQRLYDFLDTLLLVQFQKEKQQDLENLNRSLTVVRYQTRLLLDFELVSLKRYEYISTKLDDIGTDLGAWIQQQRRKSIP